MIILLQIVSLRRCITDHYIPSQIVSLRRCITDHYIPSQIVSLRRQFTDQTPPVFSHSQSSTHYKKSHKLVYKLD